MSFKEFYLALENFLEFFLLLLFVFWLNCLRELSSPLEESKRVNKFASYKPLHEQIVSDIEIHVSKLLNSLHVCLSLFVPVLDIPELLLFQHTLEHNL